MLAPQVTVLLAELPHPAPNTIIDVVLFTPQSSPVCMRDLQKVCGKCTKWKNASRFLNIFGTQIFSFHYPCTFRSTLM